MHRITDREVETLLCALRAWQLQLENCTAFPHMDLEHPLLTVAEIDELCERLNCGEIQG